MGWKGETLDLSLRGHGATPQPPTKCPSKWTGSQAALQALALIWNFLSKFTHETENDFSLCCHKVQKTPANLILPALLGPSYWWRILNWRWVRSSVSKSLPGRLWTNNRAGWMKADECKSRNADAGSHRGRRGQRLSACQQPRQPAHSPRWCAPCTSSFPHPLSAYCVHAPLRRATL